MINEMKAAYRKELIERRRSMPKEEKARKEKALWDVLLRAFIRFNFLVKHAPVLAYVSTSIEVDTSPLIKYCNDNDIPLAVPGIVDEEMKFFLYKNGELNSEPVADFSNSICFVPALAFDVWGYRLGFGGGYYDKFLKDYECTTLGLCYEEFIMKIPVDKHDVPVYAIFTENLPVRACSNRQNYINNYID